MKFAAVLLASAIVVAPAAVRAAETEVDQADWQEQAFQELRQIVVDEGALAYLREVEERVRPPGGAPVRVAIYRHSDAFAFALPNGTVYVSAGLLARIHTESELAAVIAREGSHATAARTADSRQWTGTFLIVFAAVGKTPMLPGLWAPSSIRGLPAVNEAAADAFAIERLAAAGYDPAAAADLHARLAAHVRDSDPLHPYAYADLKWLRARADSLAALAQGKARPTSPPDRYAQRVRAVVVDTCDRSVRFGRAAPVIAALSSPARAEAYGSTGHRVLADAYRMRRGAGDVDRARHEYELALAAADADASAHLGFARLLADAGDVGAATTHFERYMASAPPDAPDRAMAAAELAALRRPP